MVITDKELNLATIVARQVSRKWRLTRFDDMQAELYHWLTVKASKGVLERYRGEQYGEQKLYTGLKRYAIQYAIKETETLTGQKLSSFNDKGEMYSYTINNINKALPYLWDYETITSSNVVENPQTGKTEGYHEADNQLEDIMLSLKIAVEQLNYAEQILLEYKYREDKTYKQIGDIIGVKEDAARMRIKRLIIKIQKLIG